MEIEEKAKAYDEMVQRVKELHETGNFLTKKQMEIICPKLAESEDERIREELIGALMWQRDCLDAKGPHDNNLILPGFTMKVGDILARLEKQKYDRMKPVYDNQDSFESALGKAWKNYNDSGARTVDGCEDNYVECAHAKGFREGYLFGLEKQKEQKPAEWSEEDEKNLNEIIHFFESLCSSLATEERHAENRRRLNFLKSLRPVSKESLQSWKPSEEQMEALKDEIGYCYACGIHNRGRELQSLYDNLYKLI